MIDESRWINYTQGLELEPDKNVGYDTTSENAILFYVEYLILKDTLGELTPSDLITFQKICDNLRTYKNLSTRYEGLFDRREGESIRIDKEILRPISHDNLTAISSGSVRWNMRQCERIAEYGIKKQFRYDNAYPESPRWKRMMFHPRDWFYWLYNGKGKYRALSYMFYPVFLGAALWSAKAPKEKTSGKLLCFTRLFGRREPILRFTWFLTRAVLKWRHGDTWLTDITTTYFRHPEHPIRILAKEVEDKGLS